MTVSLFRGPRTRRAMNGSHRGEKMQVVQLSAIGTIPSSQTKNRVPRSYVIVPHPGVMLPPRTIVAGTVSDRRHIAPPPRNNRTPDICLRPGPPLGFLWSGFRV